jgi:predicted nucleic acid-binding protein
MFGQKGLGQGMSYTVSKVFIDTNILIYSIDERTPAKKRRAREVLSGLGVSRLPVISTQIVHEFFVAATNKLKVDRLSAKKLIHTFRTMEVVENSFDLAEQAIDICILSQISFWDALIVAAAEKAKCEFIFSEDLNSGQSYRGVKVWNPFVESGLP